LLAFFFFFFLGLTSKSMLIPDALGLGMFSILGAEYALQLDTSFFVAALMGIVTGVFGGVLRDVICNKIPLVFGKKTQLYATCSLAGSVVYIILIQIGIDQGFASFTGILLCVLMRLLAVRYNVRLPDPINL